MKKTVITNCPWARFTGNRFADPNFNQIQYCNEVHYILQAARDSGIRYSRAFSEPRKTTGYRTKLWMAAIEDLKELQRIADIFYPGKFNVTILSHRNHYGSHDRSLVITPVDKQVYMLKYDAIA